MKMKSPSPEKMIRNRSFIPFIIILLLVSCTNKKNKTEHGELIPEKTFISILADINLANGLLSLPEVRYVYESRDSVRNYMDIVESYGYSYEQMNGTLKYYVITKPRKIIKIYDQVIRKMTEMESAIQNEINIKEAAEQRERMNSNIYLFPDPESKENPAIISTFSPPGTFSLMVTTTVFIDDQSFNPHVSIWVADADSIETGKKRWIRMISYVKDSNPHTYIFSGRIETKRPVLIKAVLLDYDNNISGWERHAVVNFTSLTFVPDPV